MVIRSAYVSGLSFSAFLTAPVLVEDRWTAVAWMIFALFGLAYGLTSFRRGLKREAEHG